MMSKSESIKFFSFLGHPINGRNRFLWLFYFSVTQRNVQWFCLAKVDVLTTAR